MSSEVVKSYSYVTHEVVLRPKPFWSDSTSPSHYGPFSVGIPISDLNVNLLVDLNLFLNQDTYITGADSLFLCLVIKGHNFSFRSEDFVLLHVSFGQRQEFSGLVDLSFLL